MKSGIWWSISWLVDCFSTFCNDCCVESCFIGLVSQDLQLFFHTLSWLVSEQRIIQMSAFLFFIVITCLFSLPVKHWCVSCIRRLTFGSLCYHLSFCPSHFNVLTCLSRLQPCSVQHFCVVSNKLVTEANRSCRGFSKVYRTWLFEVIPRDIVWCTVLMCMYLLSCW